MIFDTYITQNRKLFLKMLEQTYIKSFDTRIYIYIYLKFYKFEKLMSHKNSLLYLIMICAFL